MSERVEIKSAYILFTSGQEKIVPISSIETKKEFVNRTDFNRNEKLKVWMAGTKDAGDFLLNAFILLLGSKYIFIHYEKNYCFKLCFCFLK